MTLWERFRKMTSRFYMTDADKAEAHIRMMDHIKRQQMDRLVNPPIFEDQLLRWTRQRNAKTVMGLK